MSLTLVTETGEKVNSSHTHEVRLTANTEFGERFAFDMNALNPREVTLFVRVFQKHHIHKREGLGWFAIGETINHYHSVGLYVIVLVNPFRFSVRRGEEQR